MVLQLCGGNSLGEMIYSSRIDVSQEIISGSVHNFLPCHLESFQNRLKICQKCMLLMSSQFGTLPITYVEEGKRLLREQWEETINADTGLVEWNERRYPFGCWLSCFPDLGVRQKFYSLTIIDLYERGLRFKGEIWVDVLSARQFTEKFGGCMQHSHQFHEFVDHVQEAIHVDDTDFPLRLSQVRGTVYDISIYLESEERRGEAMKNSEGRAGN